VLGYIIIKVTRIIKVTPVDGTLRPIIDVAVAAAASVGESIADTSSKSINNEVACTVLIFSLVQLPTIYLKNAPKPPFIKKIAAKVVFWSKM